jgi:hypothetical protein
VRELIRVFGIAVQLFCWALAAYTRPRARQFGIISSVWRLLRSWRGIIDVLS